MQKFVFRICLAAVMATLFLTTGWTSDVHAQAEAVTVERIQRSAEEPEESIADEIKQEATEKLIEEPGVLVVSVLPESPAAEAGIARGDIILAVNGNAVADAAALVELVQTAAPGDDWKATVLHGDEERTLSITLGDNEDAAFLGIRPFLDAIEVHTLASDGQALPVAPKSGNGTQEDVVVARPVVAARAIRGVVIVEVTPDSPAAEVGLAAGDIIAGVGGEDVESVEALRTRIVEHAPGDAVVLRVQRAEALDVASTVTATLAAHPEDETMPYLGVRLAPAAPHVVWMSEDTDVTVPYTPQGAWSYGMHAPGMFYPIPVPYPGVYRASPSMIVPALPSVPSLSPFIFYPYQMATPWVGWHTQLPLVNSGEEMARIRVLRSGQEGESQWNFALPGVVAQPGMVEFAAPQIELAPEEMYEVTIETFEDGL